jgi:hypothetical protein
VQPPLADGFPFEVFHGVRDVDGGTIDSGGSQRLVQDPARGTNERPAFPIFTIARLFSHHEHARARGAFTKYRLRSDFPKRTPAAAAGRLP